MLRNSKYIGNSIFFLTAFCLFSLRATTFPLQQLKFDNVPSTIQYSRRIKISRILDKSNSRCLEQNNRSHPYQFTQNDYVQYSIGRTLDVSNKFVGPLTTRELTVTSFHVKQMEIQLQHGQFVWEGKKDQQNLQFYRIWFDLALNK